MSWVGTNCPFHGSACAGDEACAWIQAARADTAKTLKAGDRVTLTSARTWPGVENGEAPVAGVLASDWIAHEEGFGPGTGCYHVRWDGFHYGNNENHHYVGELAIALEGPGEKEIRQVFGIEDRND